MIHLKKILTALFLTLGFFTSSLNAQDFARNGFYVEVGGAAKFYSFNYERFLFNTNFQNLALRVGTNVMIKGEGGSTYTGFAMPISLTYLHRIVGRFLLEGGLFITPFSEIKDMNLGNGSSSGTFGSSYVANFYGVYLGARFQPSEKGFFLAFGAQYQNGDLEDVVEIYMPTQDFWGSVKVGFVF